MKIFYGVLIGALCLSAAYFGIYQHDYAHGTFELVLVVALRLQQRWDREDYPTPEGQG